MSSRDKETGYSFQVRSNCIEKQRGAPRGVVQLPRLRLASRTKAKDNIVDDCWWGRGREWQSPSFSPFFLTIERRNIEFLKIVVTLKLGRNNFLNNTLGVYIIYIYRYIKITISYN